MKKGIGISLIISLIILFGCSVPSEDSGTIPKLGRVGDFLIINGDAVNIYSITFIRTKKIVGAHRTVIRIGDRNFYAYTGSQDNCEWIRDQIVVLMKHPQ